jgi:hypothetical protein
MESQITFLSWHVVTNLHAVNFSFISFLFVQQKVLTPFKHDVHVCVFTMMYMFVNCICTRDIKACIHQGLNTLQQKMSLYTKWFTRFWVNSLVYWTKTSELHPYFVIVTQDLMKHTKVLTTKLFQYFINQNEKA